MADIQLNHAPISQAVDDIARTAQQMASAVEDLIGQLVPLSTSFQGAAADVFSEISANRQKIYDDLTGTIASGGFALGDMQQEMIDGDNRAAATLGG
jgi:uncharacterized protein YukE